jgi:hypothetical protein
MTDHHQPLETFLQRLLTQQSAVSSFGREVCVVVDNARGHEIHAVPSLSFSASRGNGRNRSWADGPVISSSPYRDLRWEPGAKPRKKKVLKATSPTNPLDVFDHSMGESRWHASLHEQRTNDSQLPKPPRPSALKHSNGLHYENLPNPSTYVSAKRENRLINSRLPQNDHKHKPIRSSLEKIDDCSNSMKAMIVHEMFVPRSKSRSSSPAARGSLNDGLELFLAIKSRMDAPPPSPMVSYWARSG